MKYPSLLLIPLMLGAGCSGGSADAPPLDEATGATGGSGARPGSGGSGPGTGGTASGGSGNTSSGGSGNTSSGGSGNTGSGGSGNTSSGGSGNTGSGGSGNTGSGGSGNTGSGGSGNSGSGGAGGGPGSCMTAQTFNSKATHYVLATPLVHCSYPTNTLPQLYAALNEQDYADAAMCGACARVQGPNGTVEVQIVDECPYADNPQWCYPGSHHIDLNQAAFSRIGNLVTGVIDVQWQIIPCSVQGGLSITFKEGSSVYWTAVLIRNHPYRLTKVEYKNSSSGYKTLERKDYNYWIECPSPGCSDSSARGFGTGPYSFRLTDVTGGVVEVTGVASLGQQPLGAARVDSTSTQFPACQ
jgi:expansin (peptidoglycan-binding protein)